MFAKLHANIRHKSTWATRHVTDKPGKLYNMTWKVPADHWQHSHHKQDAQLSQRDRAAGCVI